MTTNAAAPTTSRGPGSHVSPRQPQNDRYAKQDEGRLQAEQDVRHIGARPRLQQRQQADQRHRQQRVAFARGLGVAAAMKRTASTTECGQRERVDDHREDRSTSLIQIS